MKNPILRIIVYFAVFIFLFIIQKAIFTGVYASLIDCGPSDVIDVIIHGLSMDCAMAGYLTIVPAILTIAAIWSPARIIIITDKIYTGLIAIILSTIFCLDLILYGYWGFRLDTTPLFYFTTSPSAAMASTGVLNIIGGIVATILIAAGIYFFITRTAGRIKVSPNRSIGATIITVVLTAALFIPIRGGFTVSTMNLSRAYFSQNQRLNHAAINPAFSFMYSATHQSDFASQYRFMDANEAKMIFADLVDNQKSLPDSTATLVNTPRPDIIIIILESFSSHLLPALGGDSIALGLDSIARDGLLFTRFYANSFRTDRALTSILSAYPAQPSTSIMKLVDKMENLPALSRSLKDNGWRPSYFYGGDANFTNMLAYLVHSGFENIISDKDFPLSQRKSKWGAHDDILFTRAFDDITDPSRRKENQARFDVIQTSSSHEPFEVPYDNPHFSSVDKRVNAFAYTDSCMTSFINQLAMTPQWDNTLVIIVPDHYGAWPQSIEDPLSRHQIPLVMTGGALAMKNAVIDTPGCQTDIAATLLAALGIKHDEFLFSKNILNTESPHFAIFTERDIIGLISETDTAVVNLDTGNTIAPYSSETAALSAKAFLQTLYDHLSTL